MLEEMAFGQRLAP